MERNRLLVIVMCLLLSAGCGQSANPSKLSATSTPTALSIQKQPTICTELGCYDALEIHIDGGLPNDYMIELEDQAGQVFVIHCLWKDRSAHEEGVASGSTFRDHWYRLDDPKVKDINALSSAPSLCDSKIGRVNHAVGALASEDQPFVQWVAVQCFDPKTDFGPSHCSPDGATIVDFAPEELTLTLHWRGNTYTETIRPFYSTYRPNGPDCPPECRGAEIDVTLPPP